MPVRPHKVLSLLWATLTAYWALLLYRACTPLVAESHAVPFVNLVLIAIWLAPPALCFAGAALTAALSWCAWHRWEPMDLP